MSAEPLRYELKFAALPTETWHILQWLRAHSLAFRESYPPRRVNSVYFDSLEYSDYAQTIEGMSGRSKVRLRWYGKQTSEIRSQLEVKNKRNFLTWKLTYELVAPISLDESWNRITETLRRNVPRAAVPWLVERPQPVIMNCYTRRYFETRDGSIRATIDGDQQVYDQRYGTRPNLRRRTPISPATILEVKAPPELAPEVGAALAGLPLRLSRNSKYCQAVQYVSA
jgi:SPX domain protein involved in polyphosphate accumulation